MILIRFLFIFVFLFPSQEVYAHVKWFTGEEAIKASIEQIISPLFVVISMLIAMTLALLPQIIPQLMKMNGAQVVETKLGGLRPYTPFILRIGTAIALLLQVLYDSILAPEIGLTPLTLWVGILVILMLLIPRRIPGIPKLR